MRNWLHDVLGGCVRCRRIRHTCTICSFPGYCLGIRMRQKVFFRGFTPFCPIYWPYFCLNVEICRFLCWQTTDDRRQTTDKLIALPPAAHARTRGNNNSCMIWTTTVLYYYARAIKLLQASSCDLHHCGEDSVSEINSHLQIAHRQLLNEEVE